MMVNVKNCGFCKSPFNANKNAVYCSIKCSSQSFKNRKRKVCLKCNKEYEIVVSADKNINRSKYCSEVCRRKAVKELLTKNKESICEMCYKKFLTKPSVKRRFCGIPCYREYQHSPKWKRELTYSGVGEFNKFKKESLKCECCNISHNIHIHHKDGNRKNNTFKNWIPLCKSCHNSLHVLYREAQKSMTKFSNGFIRIISKLHST